MGELAGVGADYSSAETFRALHQAPVNDSLEDLEADRLAADRLLGR